MARIVLAGYLVRNPLGGYAWQAAHYLLGLCALGHDAWFYEDTGHFALAYNPLTNDYGPRYEHGIAATADFLGRIGLGERWVFVDAERGVEQGPGAGRAAQLLREADLLINIAGVNRIPPERRVGRPAVYVDIDPAFTQIKAAEGDSLLRAILDEHAHLFTFGENIGTPRSPVPAGGYVWHPTRAPVALEWWADAGPPGTAYTTVGKWDAGGRDVRFRGETFAWRKRTEWIRCLDLPRRTGLAFEIAMDVDSVAGDRALLASNGWQIVDPLAVSADPWRYRERPRGHGRARVLRRRPRPRGAAPRRGAVVARAQRRSRARLCRARRGVWGARRTPRGRWTAGRAAPEHRTGPQELMNRGDLRQDLGLHPPEELVIALEAMEEVRQHLHLAPVAGKCVLLHRALGRGELDLRPRRVGNPGRGRRRQRVGRGRGRPERIVHEVGEDHEVLRQHVPRLQGLHRLGDEVARMGVVEVRVGGMRHDDD